MGLLAALLVAAGCPPETQHVAVFQARNVAAADAVLAVNAFAAGHGLRAVATADPVTNVVRVRGEAAPVRRVHELLAGLDRRPTQVGCELLFVQLPAGFVEAVGLGEPDGGRWVLTRREGQMLTAAISRTVHQKGGDILSRSQLTMADTDTGFFQVDRDGRDTIVARVTPRCGPDGSVLLRLEARIADVGAGGQPAVRTVYEVLTTVSLPAGGTLAVRVPVPATSVRPATELLVLATPRRLASEGGER